MVFIVCALACEAHPIISHFKLKSNLTHGSQHFPIYQNEEVTLIVSGIGKVNAAAATSNLAALIKNRSGQAWLNIGIGGHREYEKGTGFLIHKIIDEGSGKVYYPPLVINFQQFTETVITVEQVEVMYQDPVIYDMEASGFYAIASRISTMEFIHCYKIISDNKQSPSSQLNKSSIQEMIEKNLSQISQIILCLKEASHQFRTIYEESDNIHEFVKECHFTTTQIYQLKHLLRRWKALQPSHSLWDSQISSFKRPRDLLRYLEEKINSQPLNFSKEKDVSSDLH